jgi:ATP-dependent helicase/nuclease subunit A
LGIIPLARAREAGETRAGNLLKALELAHLASSQGARSFPEMVAKLTSHYGEIEEEEMPVEPWKARAVRLMNLHKAKGLEANVVFLADPLKDSDHEPDIHISRVGKDATGHFVAKVKLGEFKTDIAGLPPDWEKCKAVEEMYEKAEQERLLYVATTRARQLLVVSCYPSKSEKGAWTDLYPYLGAVKELEEPPTVGHAAAGGSIAVEEFESAGLGISRRIAGGGIHSYEKQTVTAMAESQALSAPFAGGDEGGMSWGRIIHGALEALSKNEGVDLEAVIENLLKEEGRPISERQAVADVVQGVVSSNFWARMKKSQESFVEVPFAFKIDGVTPSIVTGTIDLIFKEADGWVIADYKSDRVDGRIDDLIARYKPQVVLYRDFWEKITGETVHEAGIYFTAINKWVAV